MKFFTFYQIIFFVRLVNTIGSTSIVSEPNRNYMTDFRATKMPTLAVSRCISIDPTAMEHNSACCNYLFENEGLLKVTGSHVLCEWFNISYTVNKCKTAVYAHCYRRRIENRKIIKRLLTTLT